MTVFFTVGHIDDCFPEYLGDHHNRDGEYLIGVSIDGTTLVHQVYDAVLGEALDADLPDDITEEMVVDAVNAEFEGIDKTKLWNDDLEADMGDEMPQAWFLLQWGDEE